MTVLDRLTARDFHPELRAASRLLPRRAFGPRSLRPMRRLLGALPGGGDVAVERITDEVSVRLHLPAVPVTPTPGLLWIHGGGLVMGKAQQDDRFCRKVAAELGVLVAAVDYRLAPEHPYPAPLDDCMSALDWLAARPDVDSNRIAVGGASAGGGLAAAVALCARDEHLPRLRLQLLVYPMLDDRTAAKPDPHPARRRLWNNTANRFGWSSYLGTEPGRADVSPYAAPARCTELTELAPAWIGVGTNDLFHDEAINYAHRLRQAGVPCALDIVDGAFHGFEIAGRERPVVAQWIERQVAALGAALTGLSDERCNWS